MKVPIPTVETCTRNHKATDFGMYRLITDVEEVVRQTDESDRHVGKFRPCSLESPPLEKIGEASSPLGHQSINGSINGSITHGCC